MKATINGIIIEGTAQEIADVIRLVNVEGGVNKNVPTPRNKGVVIPWDTYRPEITCADGRIAPYTTTVPSAGKYDMW
ncbi:hypothetical protein MKY63_00745 [Paenibacillus sp. FSL R7-0189]|uniref:hypothetical protein n=1 Tax=Paenibacillus sp. FSL R7-0189 TaxID=2921673 RepID=UPI0030D8DDD1